MKTQFVATRKIIEGNSIIEMKGFQMEMSDALFAIRQLQKIYDKDGGWQINHWVENRRGKQLVDFEMEAGRELMGRNERVIFSMARQDQPVRRYR